MLEPSSAVRKPKPTSKRIRAKRPQTSYLKPTVNKLQVVLDELLARVASLQADKARLEGRLQAAETGIEAADAALLKVVASRHSSLAVGRWAQHLQLEVRQHCCTLQALPPPEAWGGAESPLARWSSEQIRFLQFHGSKHSCESFRENSTQLHEYLVKSVKFGALQLLHNSDTWLRGVKGCNLLTGEKAPEDAYEKAMASVSIEALPADFLAKLQAGLARYRAEAAGILQRGAELQRRLMQLLGSCSARPSEQQDQPRQAQLLGAPSQSISEHGAQPTGSSQFDRLAGLASMGGPSWASWSGGGKCEAEWSVDRGSGLGGRGASDASTSGRSRCTSPAPSALAAVTARLTDTLSLQQMLACPSSCTVEVLGEEPHNRSSQPDPTTPIYTVRDGMGLADQLLQQLHSTFTELLHAQTIIYPPDYLGAGPGPMPGACTTQLLVNACLPYHFDIPRVAEALCARAMQHPSVFAKLDPASMADALGLPV